MAISFKMFCILCISGIQQMFISGLFLSKLPSQICFPYVYTDMNTVKFRKYVMFLHWDRGADSVV
jgi:hypothetical protein